jgi:hypothetical protein
MHDICQARLKFNGTTGGTHHSTGEGNSGLNKTNNQARSHNIHELEFRVALYLCWYSTARGRPRTHLLSTQAAVSYQT